MNAIKGNAGDGKVRSVTAPELYLDGYITQRYDNGDVPVIGYPKNHLPTTPNDMEVVTGYLADQE